MSISGPGEALPDHDFRLRDWLVQPRLNRVGRGDEVVQIEPKLMDVLVLLAARRGEVVSKQEINDTVWAGVFVTESVITRAIAGLRRVLGDDAQRPSFIETISKRGYRLLVPPVPAGAAPAGAGGPGVDLGGLDRAGLPGTGANPYVVGQWVRGERFYGRGAHLAEVLTGTRSCLWLQGMRRIGKTSVLKQLELLTSGCDEGGFVPVYWDLEGAQSVEELHLDLKDALLDAGDRLERLGINVEQLGGDDVLSVLGHLRRAVHATGRTLLLLCDEAEELIRLRDESPVVLRRLRSALHARDGVRTVLASSPRLWALADDIDDTSPFLEAFLPPLVLGPLTADEAQSLALQDQLEPVRRPALSPDDARRIAGHCGNHPYLIQILARRTLEHGDLQQALEATVGDRSLGFFFSVDHQLLSPSEQALLRAAADHPSDPAALTAPADTGPSGAEPLIRRLLALGLLRQAPNGTILPASTLLRTWLLEHH